MNPPAPVTRTFLLIDAPLLFPAWILGGEGPLSLSIIVQSFGAFRHLETAHEPRPGVSGLAKSDPGIVSLLPHHSLDEGESFGLVRLGRKQVGPGLDPGDYELER